MWVCPEERAKHSALFENREGVSKQHLMVSPQNKKHIGVPLENHGK